MIKKSIFVLLSLFTVVAVADIINDGLLITGTYPMAANKFAGLAVQRTAINYTDYGVEATVVANGVSNAGVAVFAADAFTDGAVNALGHIVGFRTALNHDGNVPMASMYGFHTQEQVISTAGLSQYIGYYTSNLGGYGPVGNTYGFYVEPMTRGSNANYGIYIGAPSNGSTVNEGIHNEGDTTLRGKVTLPAQAAISGTRFLCIDTAGVVKSQSTMCSGN